MASGYSGTPLIRKLGIREGFAMLAVNPPEDYDELLGDLPADASFRNTINVPVDFIHYFETNRVDFEARSLELINYLKNNGMLWVSWPKGSSGVDTNLNRDIIRNYLLKTNLVDVKVCSIDETWSALKFVIRKELR